MNNLRKFTTEAEYSAATLIYPSVAWVTSTDTIHFDKTSPAPTFSGLTVTYNISDTTQPTDLFHAGGGSGSGSGSGSGGVLPSSMIIDGTEVDVTDAYAFDTVGEHIVNYSFAENQIPNDFLNVQQVPSLKETAIKVEIGDAITSIGVCAFNDCENITAVTIGNGVTSIEISAFNGCTSITSIDIPSGVTSIGNYAFSVCIALTSITISSGVTSIGDGAFSFCRSLTSVTIPNSVTSISSSAFENCTSLTSIIVDSNNTVYDSRNNCNAIIETSTNTLIQGCNNTVIPNSVTSIGNFAFGECSGLTTVDIPSGVTSIGYSAFYNCTGLTSIVSNATTAPTIQSNTFSFVKTGGTLYVPSGSSGYDVWMQNANYYLGFYGWTKVEQ